MDRLPREGKRPPQRSREPALQELLKPPDGRATNISAWVNEALHRQAAHDDRMRALDSFLLAYEAEHGVISEDEIRAASRLARAKAVVVRGAKRTAASGRSRTRPSGARDLIEV